MQNKKSLAIFLSLVILVFHKAFSADLGAKDDFEKVLSLEAESSVKVLAYSNLAVLFGDPLWSGRNLQRAIEILRQGSELVVPGLDTIEIRLNLAFFLSEVGEKQQALQQIETALLDLDRAQGGRIYRLKEAARALDPSCRLGIKGFQAGPMRNLKSSQV